MVRDASGHAPGDRALVDRCLQGDVPAFDELYRRHIHSVRRLCAGLLGDTHEAEDFAQEAFVRAWQRLPGLQGDRLFLPWVRAIASNMCMDALRRRQRTTLMAEPAEPDPGPTEPAPGERDPAVDLDLARRAVTRLPARHRKVIHMRELQGWDYGRIADAEGLNQAAARALLMRARRSLRREFAALARSEGVLAGVPFVGWALRRLRALPSGGVVIDGRYLPWWGGVTSAAASLVAAAGTLVSPAFAIGGPAARPAVQAPPAASVVVAAAVAPTPPAPATGETSAGSAPGGLQGSVVGAPAPFAASGAVRPTDWSGARAEADGDPVHAGVGGIVVGADPGSLLGAAARAVPYLEHTAGGD